MVLVEVHRLYLHEGEMPTSDFDIHVALNSGIAIKEIASTSHKVEVRYARATHADIDHGRHSRSRVFEGWTGAEANALIEACRALNR